MVDYHFCKDNNLFDFAEPYLTLNNVILIEYFLIYWADEDWVSVVSQHTCQGRSDTLVRVGLILVRKSLFKEWAPNTLEKFAPLPSLSM